MASLADNLRKIDPYVAGEQPNYPDMIKLNTNENPYPPAPGVLAALEAFDSGVLRLYPSTDASKLRKAIAGYHGVSEKQVFVGVGSDDVLANIFQSCFNSGIPILFPEVTYSFYRVWANLYGISYRLTPMRQDFTIDKKDYIGNENGGVVIANPNAPTSIFMPLEDIRDIVEANSERVVVIDEAYVDFGGESALALLDTHPNLVVVRTFSKSRSLAGLRIGYAVASEQIIATMESVKDCINSYPMNCTAIEVGAASLDDEAYFRGRIEAIVKTRAVLTEGLKKLGFTVMPSSANFVFASHPGIDAGTILSRLRQKHIYVRHFNSEPVKDYLRITVGTDEQVDRLLAALKEITDEI
ncbi:MAG: histidinol-phosphate transaminase [Lachnospiraceae bacterium]|nr:histidinol-phosphate transaminase [Lachnospiraceae bacterium]